MNKNNQKTKENFRCKCLAKLKKTSKNIRYRNKDKYIVAKLYEIVKIIKAQTIMLYIPLEIEVDIKPLITKLRMEKKVILAPFMEGKSFRLVKYRLPLTKKRFGIKEPKNSKQFRKKNIDLAIVPIVGTDITKRRVGFGKGMYDRFFEKEKENIGITVFIARELYVCSECITNEYDIEADFIIT
ncbi:MAG: 5-formyltetrahydrofolate cyclo-ligase [Sulfurovaceae bacterium]|nr:5-formyltetrahydrofolate cyclo-ligase [Sulfurovaceae bacterium]